MPETTVAKLMLWGGIRFAMIGYGLSVMFALIILFLKDKHKRNWLGALSMLFAILATSIVFYYYTTDKEKSRIELLKTLYYYPESVPYHEGAEDG